VQLDLFRVRVFGIDQADAFRAERTAQELFRSALFERPTVPSRRGVFWHIGNVEPIDNAGLYFRLGRTTRATLPMIDEESGDFVEQEFESAPYTHVIADTELEVCAIARKTNLAPSTTAMARQLAKLLTHAPAARERGAVVEVSAIADPEQFVETLRRAFSVTFFRVTFKRPNPWDQEGDFLRPLSRAVEAVSGESGDASLKGRDLDVTRLEDITRSVAATGDNATARMYLSDERRSVYRSLRGDSATVSADSLDDAESRAEALAKLRAAYGQVRHRPE
jgi:hypothetical protein